MIRWIQNKYALVMWDKNLKSLLLWSGIALFISFFGYVSTYFILLITGRWFGAEWVGILTMTQTISSLLVQFSLMGFATLLSRMVGEKRGTEKLHEMRPILKKLILISWLAWVFLSTVIFVLAPWIATHFFWDPGLDWLVRLVPIGSLGGIWMSFGVVYLKWVRKIFLGELLQISYKVTTLVVLSLCLYWFFWFWYSAPVAYIIGEFSMGCIAIGWLWWYLFHFPQQQTSMSVSSVRLIRMWFPLFLVFLSWMIMRYIDTIMIGYFLDSKQLGIYSIALRVVMIAAIPLGVFGGITAPEIARLYTVGDLSELNRVLRLFSFLMTWLALPVFLVSFFFPEFVLGFFGTDFEQGWMVLRILIVGYLVHVWSGNNAEYMNMLGYERAYRNIVLIASLINIILNFLLISPLGIVGVAIATSLSLIIWNLSANIYIYKKDTIRTYLWF